MSESGGGGRGGGGVSMGENLGFWVVKVKVDGGGWRKRERGRVWESTGGCGGWEVGIGDGIEIPFLD